MEEGSREQGDNIVFPDEQYTSPSAEVEDEVTTVTNQLKTSYNGTILAVVIFSVCIILIIGVIILYKKYKKSKTKIDKTEFEISLPTLGTQYELSSLLTINTVGRKSSNHSEGSTHTNDDLEKCDKSQDVFDGRVSRYIDASTVEMSRAEEYMAEHGNYTLNNILDLTRDQINGSSQSFNLKPPCAVPENSTSRPMSIAETSYSAPNEVQQISTIGGEESSSRPISKIVEEYSDSSSQEIPNNPLVQIFPPSSYLKKRPKSENVENRPPLLPSKKKLGSASSELAMNNIQQLPSSPAAARSDSQLLIIPPIPPKLKPFLPPKQTINKSKEDVTRINKEILRKSSQIMNGHAGQGNQDIQTKFGEDVDYDFPTGSGEDEDDEYDEPCPVLLKSDHHEQLDYDDPVQKYS